MLPFSITFKSFQIIRKWYFQANVLYNETFFPVEDAQVNAFDKYNGVYGPWITDGDGLTSVEDLIDYVNDAGVQDYYSNYTISACDSTGCGYVEANMSLGNFNSTIKVADFFVIF